MAGDGQELRDGQYHGCHLELNAGEAPDGCVLDRGSPLDCTYATLANGSVRESKWTCQYWRPVEVQPSPDGQVSVSLNTASPSLGASVDPDRGNGSHIGERPRRDVGEVADLRAALQEIANQDVIEIALDPDWPRRIAKAALGLGKPDA